MKIIPFKDRKIDLHRKVEVYRNLNKMGTWYSIKQDGLVAAHSKHFSLDKVQMKVSASGQSRAKETKERNVHAYCVGFLSDNQQLSSSILKQNNKLHYNPYTNESFIDSTGQPIWKTKSLYFTENGVFIK